MSRVISQANRLKEARRCRQLSQRQLARICGIDQSIISRWESGQRDIPEWGISQLSAALEIDSSFFALGLEFSDCRELCGYEDTLTRCPECEAFLLYGFCPDCYL
jgi:transcriptional regulator with XRE-family HTH domain